MLWASLLSYDREGRRLTIVARAYTIRGMAGHQTKGGWIRRRIRICLVARLVIRSLAETRQESRTTGPMRSYPAMNGWQLAELEDAQEIGGTQFLLSAPLVSAARFCAVLSALGRGPIAGHATAALC